MSISRFKLDELATLSFEEFTLAASPDELPTEYHQCLADYISSWVEAGHGVRVCNGDFQTFTLAVIAIIDDWHQNSTILDYAPKGTAEDEDPPMVERRVSTIFGDTYGRHQILDPYFFAKATFRELHGDQSSNKS